LPSEKTNYLKTGYGYLNNTYTLCSSRSINCIDIWLWKEKNCVRYYIL